MSWGRMDSSWISHDRGLKNFLAGQTTGESLAALKVLLAIASHGAYETATALLSYGDLELLTGLSRPMAIRGVAGLEGAGLVEVTRGTGINSYRLINAETPPWSKVPIERIETRLRKMPNRGESALAAMKILVLLLAFRDNRTSFASMTHRTMVEYTGVRPAVVRQGIDHLISHGFVHLNVEANFSAKVGHPVFIYHLQGHFDGGAYRRVRPMLNPLITQATQRQTTYEDVF